MNQDRISENFETLKVSKFRRYKDSKGHFEAVEIVVYKLYMYSVTSNKFDGQFA